MVLRIGTGTFVRAQQDLRQEAKQHLFARVIAQTIERRNEQKKSKKTGNNPISWTKFHVFFFLATMVSINEALIFGRRSVLGHQQQPIREYHVQGCDHEMVPVS